MFAIQVLWNLDHKNLFSVYECFAYMYVMYAHVSRVSGAYGAQKRTVDLLEVELLL